MERTLRRAIIEVELIEKGKGSAKYMKGKVEFFINGEKGFP